MFSSLTLLIMKQNAMALEPVDCSLNALKIISQCELVQKMNFGLGPRTWKLQMQMLYEATYQIPVAPCRALRDGN